MNQFKQSKRRSKIMATSAMALALTIGGGLLSGSSAFADTATTDSSTSAAVTSQAGAGHGGKFGHGGGMFAGKGGIQAYLDKLTAYLKLDEATLKEKLKTESLADIAAEQSISRDDLKAQLTAWIQEAIANAGAATGTTSGTATDSDTATTRPALDPSAIADKLLDAKGGQGVRMGQGGGFGYDQAAVAAALGVSEDDLKTALSSGKTLADVATEKGVDAQTVIDAITKSITAKLDEALAAGKITQTQHDDQAAAAAKMADAIVNGKFGGGMKGGFGKGGGFGYDQAAVATALGVSEDDLKTALSSGKTLADVATDKGVDAQTVIDAITKSIAAKLDEALAAGKITQEQHDDQAANAAARAEAIVSGKFGGGGRGGFSAGSSFDADTVATAIGVTVDELKAVIATGQTVSAYAESKGVDTQTVANALTSKLTDELDQLLSEGQLTQEDYNHRSGNIASEVNAILHDDYAGTRQQNTVFDNSVIASALGITVDELKAAFKSGQTVGDIAQSKLISSNVVVEAAGVELKAQLDQLLADGKITQTEYMDRYNQVASQANEVLISKGARGDRQEHRSHNRDGMQSSDDQTTSSTDSSNT